ncbi:hypothetical protein BH20ACT10_BH20ACT10_17790 [soil metagenome]|nr:MarR family transcriptional regulator [Rubrobacter sp.]
MPKAGVFDPAAPNTETVGCALAKADRAYRASVGEILSGLGLHVGQERVLAELFREDGLRSGELALRLGIVAATATKMLSRMETSGLIVRQPDPDDARCGRILLTEKGRSLESPLKKLRAENEEKLLAGLDDEERRELVRLLGHVRRNLENNGAEE